jgi:hypothetical protein
MQWTTLRDLMRTIVALPRRSLPSALTLGALSGLVFLGVGGRIAMRIFAVLDGRIPGMSPGGTATIVFMGAAWGLVGGGLLWLGRRVFAATPWARGLLFWGVLGVLFARGLRPMTIDSLVSFTPFVLLYGAVTYRIWCRRFISTWSHPAAATLPTPQPT